MREQDTLLAAVEAAIESAPLFQPRMPRTGKPFSVRMTNCGALGWVSDQERGYRYQAEHPETGRSWPAIPVLALRAWEELGDYPHAPEACLINVYGPEARMGLHQDRGEADLTAPVVSLSLGASCIFRWGPTRQRQDAIFGACVGRCAGPRRAGAPCLSWRRANSARHVRFA